jgi:hypothetical protein
MMKISRQQLWPSLALLAVLAGAVGYVVHAVGRRQPISPVGAAAPQVRPASSRARVLAVPPPALAKDPFAAPVASAAQPDQEWDEESPPDQPVDTAKTPGSTGGAPEPVPQAGPAGPPRPSLAGIFMGEKPLAIIHFGDERYYVGPGDLIPQVGRVIEVGGDSVEIEGPSGRFRLRMGQG